MILLLIRHGNTFRKNEPTIYIGRRSDPELTQTGLFQAHRIADALHAFDVQPSGLCMGDSKRLIQTAAILAQRLCIPTQKTYRDAVLTELDYGAWEGRTAQEVRERFGAETVEAWDKKGQWPDSKSAWGQTEDAVVAQTQAYLATLRARFFETENNPILIVSSNGRLRYFLKLVAGAWEQSVQSAQLKIATGNVACLQLTPTRQQVIAWNVTPSEVAARVRSLSENKHS